MVVSGKVLTIDDAKNTPSGHLLVKIRMQDDETGKYWVCLFWDNQANDFLQKNFLGRKIHIEGNWKNTENNEINVKFFDSNDVRSPAPARTTEADKESLKKYLEANKMALVPMQISSALTKYVTKPTSECLMVDGKLEHELEYVMRRMTPSEVTENFKKEQEGKRITDVNPQRIRYLLRSMILHCMETFGDYVTDYYGNPITEYPAEV
jgi:hypothetical protein